MHVLAAEGGPINAVFASFEDRALWVVLAISLVALAFAYYLVREVLTAPEGTEKMKEIARAIQEGAKAYLSRQFRTVGIFLALLTILLFFILPAPTNASHSELSIKLGRSLAFILGAGFSAITGYTGMWLAVRANVRTANAARESGLRKAVRVAFRAGGVAGMFTVGLGLLGATVILILGAAAYVDSPKGAIIGVMFPLFVRAVGVITSIVGILAVTPRSEDEHGMKAINRGFFISAAISAAAVFVISGIYMDTYK